MQGPKIVCINSDSGDFSERIDTNDVRHRILLIASRMTLMYMEPGILGSNEAFTLVPDELVQDIERHKDALSRLNTHLNDPKASAIWKVGTSPDTATFEKHRGDELVARACRLPQDEVQINGEAYRIYNVGSKNIRAYRVASRESVVSLGEVESLLNYNWEANDLLRIPMLRDALQSDRLRHYRRMGRYLLAQRDPMPLHSLDSIILRWMGIQTTTVRQPPFQTNLDYLLPRWAVSLLTPRDGESLTHSYLQNYNLYVRGLMQNALTRLAYDPTSKTPRSRDDGTTCPPDFGIYWDDYVAIVRECATSVEVDEGEIWDLLHKPSDVQLIKWLGGVDVGELEPSETLTEILASLDLVGKD